MWFVEAAIISGVERLALLMSFGSLIVALLAFLDRDRKNKKIMPILSEPQERRLSLRGK